jgi:hypothetical protein
MPRKRHYGTMVATLYRDACLRICVHVVYLFTLLHAYTQTIEKSIEGIFAVCVASSTKLPVALPRTGFLPLRFQTEN